ncbi:MAG: undecaprenyl-phosphate glucose phosphotransferase [Burkholderiales bacterium]|nr:undecaprenyl-phosphate glucose phosphotransferase [Burkholderiales bacterium]MCW5603270.1 undecaprenyl-phosphate glucose phosphotransferase [Burkholderiales bacterium]
MQIAVDSKTGNAARSPLELVTVTEIFLDPSVALAFLFLAAAALDGPISARHVILGIVTLSMMFPGSLRLTDSPARMACKAAVDWSLVALMLLLLGHVTGYLRYFSTAFSAGWLLLTFPLLMVSREIARRALPLLIARGHQRRAVIVGNNETGAALARKFSDDAYLGIDFVGFFDDRNAHRLAGADAWRLLGPTGDLAGFVRKHRVDHVYITLPMSSQPRILSLLDDIKDTTASVFFVPDIFMIELIQGHVNSVGGIPVVAVCETPFTGFRGFAKRASDVVLASLTLLLVSPLLIAVAIGVRLSSPGRIIFSQKRYGLDGREIVVYKFRSMSVTEDGKNSYTQVTREDPRVTPFGAFIRKTSLDELPQFINVLQGRMSIVGPRPHAVAVNEQYRKLIPSYMIRHKVRPGITGWAQVNGYRGGDDLEHMKMRIKFDLEYLRDWSLPLDLLIIFKTVALVFRDSRAF